MVRVVPVASLAALLAARGRKGSAEVAVPVVVWLVKLEALADSLVAAEVAVLLASMGHLALHPVPVVPVVEVTSGS